MPVTEPETCKHFLHIITSRAALVSSVHSTGCVPTIVGSISNCLYARMPCLNIKVPHMIRFESSKRKILVAVTKIFAGINNVYCTQVSSKKWSAS